MLETRHEFGGECRCFSGGATEGDVLLTLSGEQNYLLQIRSHNGRCFHYIAHLCTRTKFRKLCDYFGTAASSPASLLLNN